jgi:hypothetical protein
MTPSGALFRRTLTTRQVERGVDEGDVRECLREVAELTAEARVILFRQEADIVAQGQ